MKNKRNVFKPTSTIYFLVHLIVFLFGILLMISFRDYPIISSIGGYFGLIVPGVSVKMCQSERGYNNTKISY